MVDILCVGHAAYDLSMFVTGFPEENSKGETELLLESGGGPAANAACLISSWGVPCGFVGLIGDDRYGEKILDEFRRVGTDVSLVESRAGYPTPASLSVRKRGGRSSIPALTEVKEALDHVK